jgi:hypothetical protein
LNGLKIPRPPLRGTLSRRERGYSTALFLWSMPPQLFFNLFLVFRTTAAHSWRPAAPTASQTNPPEPPRPAMLRMGSPMPRHSTTYQTQVRTGLSARIFLRMFQESPDRSFPEPGVLSAHDASVPTSGSRSCCILIRAGHTRHLHSGTCRSSPGPASPFGRLTPEHRMRRSSR